MVILDLDTLEELAGAVEVLELRVGVAVHLVLGGDGGGGLGDHTHEEPVGGGQIQGAVGVVESESAVAEELDILRLDVVPVGGEVLHASLVGTLGLDGVTVEVGDFGDSGVRGLAVVALYARISTSPVYFYHTRLFPHLVVVLANQLPVVTTVSGPGALVNVLVEVEVFEALLLIGSPVELLPGDGVLGGIKIDPDEAELIDVSVDGEEAVVLLAEVFNLFKLGGLGQISRETVRPAF